MTEENKEKIELIPAEKNPWYQFYLKSIALDRGDQGEGPYGTKPYGWHWFWGIYFLHRKMPKFRRFNLTAIQKNLPDGHWLKNTSDIDQEDLRRFGGDIPDSACQGEAVVALYKILQKHKITEAPEEIDFSNLNFAKYTDLSKFIFLIRTSFRKSNFVASADFTQAQFFDFAHFIYTTFIGNSSFPFKGYIFGYTTFQEAVFHRSASFENIKSNEGLIFNATKFIGGASFSSAVFWGVNFDNAEFINSGADFQKANFSNKTSFRETKFFKGAFFKESEFYDCDFYVDFSGANFASSTFFNDAKFSGGAFFYNAKFSSYTNFENAIFENQAPKFYGAELNDEMFWTDIKLPKFERMDDETEDDYKKRIKDNENAYENLSTKLGNQKKYRDEHFFFRQELSCQRKLAESYTSRFAFWLYELFSDYGYRIGRAVWCWLGHIAFGAVVIAFIAMCGGMRFHESLPCAIPVSFANANPYVFFGFESSSLKECYKILEPLAPISFAIIKAIQTVLGIALLFLVVLTLRVRFRLK